MSLENIPWDQAFALVLQSKKLGYIRQGNVLRVATLTSLKQEKEAELASEQAKIRVEPLKTVLVPISYAKASELAPQARNFLTDRGTLDIDARTNTIIVKDIEKVVTRVQKLFAALDSQPPRVAISAKIVEIKRTYSKQIGINTLAFGSNTSGLNLGENLVMPAGTAGFGTTTISAPAFASLNATFQLGETDSKVKILANPQVSVVANRSATVSQSFSFFITNNVIAGGVVQPSQQQVTTNLTLEVTPIVAGDGSIFLTVNAKNEIPQVAGNSFTIDGRNISTQILLENGDTAVMGGVFQSTVSEATTGMPPFSQIPLLGYFFSQHNDSNNQNEIFMFLTAKITNAEESFKRSF